MKINRVHAKHFMTKTNIKNLDFTCNPYVGCLHGCLYCYAKYMTDGRTPDDKWGAFLDIKSYPNHDIKKGSGSKTLFFSSATDAYQKIEKQEGLVRSILEDICESDLKISILTKSSLVVRDIDLLEKTKSVEVGFSIALNDVAAKILEPGADLPSLRIEALKKVKAAGITTYVFIAPIFPYITDVFKIIDLTKDYVDYFMFDTLNLKHPQNRDNIFDFVKTHYPMYLSSYKDIFQYRNHNYYNNLHNQIIDYCNKEQLMVSSIYHKKEV